MEGGRGWKSSWESTRAVEGTDSRRWCLPRHNYCHHHQTLYMALHGLQNAWRQYVMKQSSRAQCKKLDLGPWSPSLATYCAALRSNLPSFYFPHLFYKSNYSSLVGSQECQSKGTKTSGIWHVLHTQSLRLLRFSLGWPDFHSRTVQKTILFHCYVILD